jgi:hypothetical protein
VMLGPDEVAAIVRLHELGLGNKTDLAGAGVQPEYGEALPRIRRPGCVPANAASRVSKLGCSAGA